SCASSVVQRLALTADDREIGSAATLVRQSGPSFNSTSRLASLFSDEGAQAAAAKASAGSETLIVNRVPTGPSSLEVRRGPAAPPGWRAEVWLAPRVQPRQGKWRAAG